MVRRIQPYYNLDVIIAVGYRVNSPQATRFRIWATGVLREVLLRGYAVNDRLDRLERRVAKTEEQIGVVLKIGKVQHTERAVRAEMQVRLLRGGNGRGHNRQHQD